MASTITQTLYFDGDDWKVVKLACAADAVPSAFAATAIDPAIKAKVREWGLYKVGYNVGATAPTANSDLTITDFMGYDILGANGANLLTTTDGEALPLIGTQPAVQPYIGTWTVNVTQEAAATASAVFDIYLYFKRWIS